MKEEKDTGKLMGVRQDIEKKHQYKELSYEKLGKIIKDMMFTKDTSKPKTKEERTWRELPEGFDLDFQIQNGYLYTVSGGLTLFTGSGGIRDIISSMREAGIADSIIAQDIFIHYNGKDYWIGDITWKKIEK